MGSSVSAGGRFPYSIGKEVELATYAEVKYRGAEFILRAAGKDIAEIGGIAAQSSPGKLSFQCPSGIKQIAPAQRGSKPGRWNIELSLASPR